MRYLFWHQEQLAEFNQNEAPFNHIEINVTYNDDDSRTYEFKSVGEDEIIEGLQK